MLVKQNDLIINQNFTKVKSICCEIFELDPRSKISEDRMRRIIIHSLRPEFCGFTTIIRGWIVQPSIEDLENLLAN
jgi:hypothetical protein